jgi:hypothetical protein
MQIPTVLNLSHIRSEARNVAMFSIKIFHTKSVRVFVVYLHTTFQMPCSLLRPTAIAELNTHFTREPCCCEASYKTINQTNVDIFFEDLLPHRISVSLPPHEFARLPSAVTDDMRLKLQKWGDLWWNDIRIFVTGSMKIHQFESSYELRKRS